MLFATNATVPAIRNKDRSLPSSGNVRATKYAQMNATTRKYTDMITGFVVIRVVPLEDHPV